MNLRGGRAVFGLIAAAAVSALGVVLTLSDIGERLAGPNRFLYILLWFGAFVVFVASALYTQWKQNEELRRQLEPKIKIVFEDREQRPYLQVTRVACSEDVYAEERRYRIGIRNLGRAEIPRVRVILEQCTPIGSDGFKRVAKDHVYPGHALQPMGQPTNTHEFLLGCSGEEPSVFVDVVHDELSSEGRNGLICFAYAATHMPHGAVSGTYRIVLRAEGGGSHDHATFIVEREPGKDRLLKMRPA